MGRSTIGRCAPTQGQRRERERDERTASVGGSPPGRGLYVAAPRPNRSGLNRVEDRLLHLEHDERGHLHPLERVAPPPRPRRAAPPRRAGGPARRWTWDMGKPGGK